MGTYHDSKIVTARNIHECGTCHVKISRGDRYLRYKLGLRNDIKRCMDCATVVTQRSWGPQPQYDCKAIRDELGLSEPSTMMFTPNGGAHG